MVIGASGSLGKPVVSALLAAGFNVSALSRESSSATFPDRVTVVKTDFTPESLETAFHGQDAVVSTVGFFGLAEQIKIIDAAAAAGVKRFIPSDFGCDSADGTIGDVVPALRPKVEAATHLQTKAGQGDFSWTTIVNGSFFDWAFNIPGALGWNLPKRTATIFDGGDIPYEATTLAQVARAVAAVLSSAEHLDASKNRHVYINSFTTTQNDVLKALEAATGEKFAVTQATRKELVDSAPQGPAATMSLIAAMIYGYPRDLNHYSQYPGGVWNERLGLPRENVDDSVREIVAGLRN